MWNDTFVQPQTRIEFPKTIEVKEQRAATDDSIRLAREYEDKVRDSILFHNYYGTSAGLYLNITVQDIGVLSFVKSYLCILQIKINEKIYTRKVKISQDQYLLMKNCGNNELTQLLNKSHAFIFYNVMMLLAEAVLHSEENIREEICKMLGKDCQKFELLNDDLVNF